MGRSVQWSTQHDRSCNWLSNGMLMMDSVAEDESHPTGAIFREGFATFLEKKPMHLTHCKYGNP
jgi:hypothetical protein